MKALEIDIAEVVVSRRAFLSTDADGPRYHDLARSTLSADPCCQVHGGAKQVVALGEWFAGAHTNTVVEAAIGHLGPVFAEPALYGDRAIDSLRDQGKRREHAVPRVLERGGQKPPLSCDCNRLDPRRRIELADHGGDMMLNGSRRQKGPMLGVPAGRHKDAIRTCPSSLCRSTNSWTRALPPMPASPRSSTTLPPPEISQQTAKQFEFLVPLEKHGGHPTEAKVRGHGW